MATSIHKNFFFIIQLIINIYVLIIHTLSNHDAYHTNALFSLGMNILECAYLLSVAALRQVPQFGILHNQFVDVLSVQFVQIGERTISGVLSV